MTWKISKTIENLKTLSANITRDLLKNSTPMTARHIFSNTHETFSRIDYIIGHKTHLSMLKSVKSYLVYSMSTLRVEIHNRNICYNSLNT